MIIEFERTLAPEDMGEATCAICGDGFKIGTVTAWVYTDVCCMVFACERCVEVLGGYRPDRFPTIEDYWRLEAEFPLGEGARES
jgi:hypothetical protein